MSWLAKRKRTYREIYGNRLDLHCLEMLENDWDRFGGGFRNGIASVCSALGFRENPIVHDVHQEACNVSKWSMWAWTHLGIAGTQECPYT